MMLRQASFCTGGSDTPRKLKDLCRMCASPCDKPVLIFGSEGVENELAVKFNSHLPIKVSESDTLPLQFCYECTNLLIQWDASVPVVIAADKKLRALQWREQQSQPNLNSSKEIIEETLSPSVKSRKRKLSSGVGELLCCSICNETRTDFRQLVEHLKSHEIPAEQKNERERRNFQYQSSPTNSYSTEEEESHYIYDGVLRPIVSLETLDTQVESQSWNSTSESQLENLDSLARMRNNTDVNKILQAKRLKSVVKIMGKASSVVEGGSGDPVVTSSTSTSTHLKPSGNSESEDLPTMRTVSTDANGGGNSLLGKAPTAGTGGKRISTPDNADQNGAFKPKVRIISAESINQTLEERAKANRNANNLESQKSPGRSSVMVPAAPHQPLPNPSGASKGQKLILTSEMIKKIQSIGKPGPKLLKLADGRIIRLVTGNPKDPSKPLLIASTQQPISQDLLNQRTAEGPTSPDPDGRKSANSSTSPIASENTINSEMILPPAPLQHNIMVNNSTTIAFNLQPGPKNKANRFSCASCGKRNMPKEYLEEHAQQHAPPKKCVISQSLKKNYKSSVQNPASKL